MNFFFLREEYFPKNEIRYFDEGGTVSYILARLSTSWLIKSYFVCIKKNASDVWPR